MEENRTALFRADMIYDLRTHKEMNAAAAQISVIQTLMNLFLICLMGFITLKYDGRAFAFIALAGSTAFCIGNLVNKLQNRNGGVAYKRTLYQHGAQVPHIRLSFEEDGIHADNIITGTLQTHSYDRVLALTETKNLLLIHLELKLLLIVNKDTLEGGTLQELTSFLRARCPHMKRRIQKGFLGRWSRRAVYAVMIACALCSAAILLDIPAMISGQITNRMSYLEIAEKLEPLGITGATAEMQEYLDEYFGEYYTGLHADYYNKATDLLAELGMGSYDEQTWEWTPSSNGVYWLDMEVFRIETMYTDFLRGIAALDPDTLSITDIREDQSQVNPETGVGTVSLSFLLNGNPYRMQIPFRDDWIDVDVLSDIASIVRQANPDKQLYFASDEGQGLLVFYRTKEWADEFTRITAIPLYDDPTPVWYG